MDINEKGEIDLVAEFLKKEIEKEFEPRVAVEKRFDHIRDSMDLKWGINKLKYLVNIDIRQKFEEQEKLLCKAILSEDLSLIEQKYEAMIRAYTALDKIAEETNMPKVPKHYIEGKTEWGDLFRIVPDGQDIYIDQIATFTISEVGRLLSRSELLYEMKKHFPNSHIKEIRNSTVEDDLEDEIPF